MKYLLAFLVLSCLLNACAIIEPETSGVANDLVGVTWKMDAWHDSYNFGVWVDTQDENADRINVYEEGVFEEWKPDGCCDVRGTWQLIEAETKLQFDVVGEDGGPGVVKRHHASLHVCQVTGRAMTQLVLEVAESEINDLDVPLRINEDVLRLQVSIYDSVLVHELNGEKELSSVEARPLHVEGLRPPDVEEEVPSVDVLHDEVESLSLVQVAVHLHDEGGD